MRPVFLLAFIAVLILAFVVAYQAGYLDSINALSGKPAVTTALAPQEAESPLPPASPTTKPSATAAPTPTTTSTPTPEPSLTPTPFEPTPVGQEGQWHLRFDDEFDGHALDPSHWTPCYWWADAGCTNGSSHELEWYLPDNVLVQNGSLHLRALKQSIQASDGKTHPYSSGLVSTGRDTDNTSTPYRFAFQYGFAEIRARVPAGKGLWPAFWMLPVSQKSLPEIDIMEVLGDVPNVVEMHVHAKDARGQEQDAGKNWQGLDFSTEFHTFAVDWQPDAITWYIDGIERWRFTDQNMIPAEPMYILLNLAVGGTWPGNPDASTTFPSDFTIDYIRVWARQ